MLVRAAHWATNVEYDLQNLVTGPLLQRLANRFHLVRYDGRGAGLSDRDVPAISLQTMLYDLEAVVDALALECFALLGISEWAATSIAYAVHHPHRVSKLVLFGGYAQGRNKRGSSQDAEEWQAFLTLGRQGWGDDRLLLARAFLSFWLPAGTPEQLKSFIELQRVAIDGRTAPNLAQAVADIDIPDMLPKVSVPTIVFHCIRDRLVPFDQGRRLAAAIPNARFVPLDSENHALLADELWTKFVEEMDALRGTTRGSAGGRFSWRGADGCELGSNSGLREAITGLGLSYVAAVVSPLKCAQYVRTIQNRGASVSKHWRSSCPSTPGAPSLGVKARTSRCNRARCPAER